MLITAKMNRKFGACYSDAVLKKLYGNGKTPEQVATLTDGLWAEVSTADRCWILWRVISTKNKAGMRECLARMLGRVLRPDCDRRSRAVIEAIRQDVVTEEIIAAAYAAEASARDAAYAAYASAYAAYASADAADAARAAARAASTAECEACAVYEAACAARAAYEAARAACAVCAAWAAAVAARAAYEARAADAADAGDAYTAAYAAYEARAAYGEDADAAEKKAQISDILEFLKGI